MRAMRSRAFAGIALASGVFLGGCASILGIDSYEEGNGGQPPSSSTSTGPTGGPSNTSGANTTPTTGTMTSTNDASSASTASGPATGEIVWAKSFGSPDDDEAWGAAIIDSGEIYLAGKTVTATSTAISIGKLDPSGNASWTNDYVIGGPSEFYARSYGLVADETGVIFAGNVDESGIMLAGQPVQGSFVAKLDPQGALVWLQSCGGQLSYESQSFSGGITYTPFGGNPRGAIVMSVPANSGLGCGTVGGGVLGVRINASTGAILSALAFDDDGYERNTRIDSSPDGNLFLSAWGFLRMFNAGGTQLWERATYVPRNDVAFDPENGGAVIVGQAMTQSSVDFGGGSVSLDGDGFMVRYDGSGAFVRQTFFGPPAQGRAVTVDASGAVYLAADFSAASHFGDNVPYPVESDGDGAIVKIDKDNNLIWKHHLQGEVGSRIELNAIALGASKVLAFGHYEGTAAIEGTPLVPNGGKDVVVVLLEP